jgi:chaperonin GroES
MVVNAAPSTPAHVFTGTAKRERNQGMAGFRPLHDRVLVKRVEAEEKTPGGIIIPDTAKEKPVEGEVLAVGPGVRDETGTVRPLDVKVGDHVLFGKWAGTEVIIDGEDRLILKEADILGVVERNARAPAKAA